MTLLRENVLSGLPPFCASHRSALAPGHIQTRHSTLQPQAVALHCMPSQRNARPVCSGHDTTPVCERLHGAGGYGTEDAGAAGASHAPHTLQDGPGVETEVLPPDRRPDDEPGVAQDVWDRVVLEPDGDEPQGAQHSLRLDVTVACCCALPLPNVGLLYVCPAPSGQDMHALAVQER